MSSSTLSHIALFPRLFRGFCYCLIGHGLKQAPQASVRAFVFELFVAHRISVPKYLSGFSIVWLDTTKGWRLRHL